MIRREPTLIPMTDEDVQDVRDLVAQQKAQSQKHQTLMVKLKRLSENPTLSEEEKEILKDLTGVLTPFKSSLPKAAGLELGSTSKTS